MQMKRILSSRQWGGKAALLVIVLASLWCDARAQAAEKVALGSSIRIEFTIDGKAVPAEISYRGTKGYKTAKAPTAIKLQRGDRYRFEIRYQQGGEMYFHQISGTVDWAGLRRVPIAYSKIKKQGPLKYVTINGKMTIVGCDESVTSVVIPEKIEGKCVTSIKGAAFKSCDDLVGFVVSADNPAYMSRKGVLLTKDEKTLVRYPAGRKDAPYTIPDGITSIGKSAFSGCSGLTSVAIPHSVTSIGDSAFINCRGLRSLTIPDSVTSIGEWAFANCRDLTSVTIPNSVTSIGDNAFILCRGLTSVTISKSVTSIGYDAFDGCGALVGFVIDPGNPAYISREGVLLTKDGKTLVRFPAGRKDVQYTIPNSVTSIGDSAFSGCSGLTSVTIPSSVTSIGESAFSYCEGLTSVTIPSSVTSIGDSVFSGCRGLKSVTIPDGVTSIRKWAFSYCEGLTSVTIPKNVTSIGENAFDSCESLTSVTIPKSVTSIGVGAFSGCEALVGFVVDPGNPAYVSGEGVLLTKGGKTLLRYPAGRKDTSCTIPDSVTSIGERAFSDCSSLTSVTIPNGVTSIGESAFYGCNGLTSVAIPNSVTSIGEGAFLWCDDLVDFKVVPGNPAYVSREGVLLTKDGKTLIRYPAGREGAFYTIPKSVTSIGKDAFANCRGLTSVTIPNSVTSIGESAFSGCNGLMSMTIPNSVTSIGESAFFACAGLKSVAIPNSVTSIGGWAFWGCSGLTSVTIPNGVTSIGRSTFFRCRGLTSVTIPKSVTSIGNEAFSGCTALTSVTIPKGVKIGWNAFEKCPWQPPSN